VKRFAFIAAHRLVWPVRVMCRVLEVTPGGYYAWRKRPPGERKIRRMELIEKIQSAHEQSNRTYGSPRVRAELLKQGQAVSVNTVAKLMKQAGIAVKTKKAFVPRTTQIDPSHATVGNALDRQFAAPLPNQKWVCDITYVPTLEGWLYLAVVIDLCSRKVVGWSMNDHLRSELAGNALAMALERRRPGAGLLHHGSTELAEVSDRGCQYTSDVYQCLLNEAKIEPSMSGVGQCWDNAVAESFFATLKRERVNEQTYATRCQARGSLFQWIECWYNRKRLHSSLGYLSPEQFEAQLN